MINTIPTYRSAAVAYTVNILIASPPYQPSAEQI